MAYSQKQFDEAIWRVVKNIRPGQVMAYGEVARAAGYPRHSRMVSQSMGRSPEPLPWYRVVRSNRTLAFEEGCKYFLKQKELLEQEGVQVIKGKVIPVVSDDDREMDELLWGPGGLEK